MVRHALRFELIALVRNRRRVLFTIAFPLLLLVVLTSTAPDELTASGVPYERFYLPGVIAMSITSGCFAALVQVVVGRRESGITRRRELTPASRRTLVTALVLATAAVALAASAFLLLVAKVALGVGVSAPALLAILVTVTFGACALSATAFLVARALPNADSAQPVVQLAMFPVLFLSGIWFPVDDLPSGLRVAMDVLPVKPLADALRTAVQADALGSAFSPGHLATLAIWTVGAGLLAARTERGLIPFGWARRGRAQEPRAVSAAGRRGPSRSAA